MVPTILAGADAAGTFMSQINSLYETVSKYAGFVSIGVAVVSFLACLLMVVWKGDDGVREMKDNIIYIAIGVGTMVALPHVAVGLIGKIKESALAIKTGSAELDNILGVVVPLIVAVLIVGAILRLLFTGIKMFLGDRSFEDAKKELMTLGIGLGMGWAFLTLFPKFATLLTGNNLPKLN
jgi:mannose/fructose/N-acetylgalactosamine-specific phosphotransferase system component IIC